MEEQGIDAIDYIAEHKLVKLNLKLFGITWAAPKAQQEGSQM